MKRFMQIAAGPLALAVGMTLGMGHIAAAQATGATDPASVLLAFEKSVGVDVDAGLALLADTATLRITPPPQGTTGSWTGKDELRQALQYSKDHLVKRDIVGTPQVDGNKVTDMVSTTNDFFVMIGVAPVQFSTEATVEGGKVTSFATTITPSEGARVGAAAQAYQAAHAAPAAPTSADQASVLVAFEKTVGSDVDAGLALLADTATLRITPPPQGTTGSWTGKDELRQALQYSKDHLVKRDLVGAPQVDGNKVTDTVSTSNDFFVMIGVAPVQFTTEAMVENGKITSFVTTITPQREGEWARLPRPTRRLMRLPLPRVCPRQALALLQIRACWVCWR